MKNSRDFIQSDRVITAKHNLYNQFSPFCNFYSLIFYSAGPCDSPASPCTVKPRTGIFFLPFQNIRTTESYVFKTYVNLKDQGVPFELLRAIGGILGGGVDHL